MDRTRTNGRAQTPFLLRVRTADGVEELTARAVIDASGTYLTPNSLGSSGLDPLGLPEVADLVSHALPDVLGRERAAFAGRHTVVVGAGHSAANTLLKLATLAEQEAGTRITWVIRNATAARVSTSPMTSSRRGHRSGRASTRSSTPAASSSSIGSRSCGSREAWTTRHPSPASPGAAATGSRRSRPTAS